MTTNCDYKDRDGKRSEFNIVKTWRSLCVGGVVMNMILIIGNLYQVVMTIRRICFMYGSFCSWSVRRHLIGTTIRHRVSYTLSSP